MAVYNLHKNISTIIAPESLTGFNVRKKINECSDVSAQVDIDTILTLKINFDHIHLMIAQMHKFDNKK